jgi:hypothetical protein
MATLLSICAKMRLLLLKGQLPSCQEFWNRNCNGRKGENVCTLGDDAEWLSKRDFQYLSNENL